MDRQTTTRFLPNNRAPGRRQDKIQTRPAAISSLDWVTFSRSHLGRDARQLTRRALSATKGMKEESDVQELDINIQPMYTSTHLKIIFSGLVADSRDEMASCEINADGRQLV